MAVLGRIQRISGDLYRNLDTGRFLPFSESEPIVSLSRVYGFRGAIATSESLGRARDTIADRYGYNEIEARDRLANFRARLAEGDDKEVAYNEEILGEEE